MGNCFCCKYYKAEKKLATLMSECLQGGPFHISDLMEIAEGIRVRLGKNPPMSRRGLDMYMWQFDFIEDMLCKNDSLGEDTGEARKRVQSMKNDAESAYRWQKRKRNKEIRDAILLLL